MRSKKHSLGSQPPSAPPRAPQSSLAAAAAGDALLAVMVEAFDLAVVASRSSSSLGVEHWDARSVELA